MFPQRKETAVALPPRQELAQIKAEIATWLPECRRGFINFLGYRYMIGRALIRAKELVPHAAGGDHTSAKFKAAASDEPEGFLAWKREAFPGIANSTLADHKAFAERVIKLHPELATVDLHELPASKVEPVFELLRDCTSGKDVTLSTRAMGLLSEATPAGGFRPNAGEVEAWLQKHHPEHAGQPWAKLSEKIKSEYMAAVRAREARRTAGKATSPDELLKQRQWEAEQEIRPLVPRLQKWALKRTLLALGPADRESLQRILRELLNQLERADGRKQGAHS